MDYVDWVERVLDATVRAWRDADANKKLIGIKIQDVGPAFGYDDSVALADSSGSKLAEALRDALKDLADMGLVEQEHGRYYKVTSEGVKYPEATLSTAWPQIISWYLEPEQLSFLRAVAEIGQEANSDCVCVKDLTSEEVLAHLGIAWDDQGVAQGYLLAKQLDDLGLIRHQPYAGGRVQIIPTYVGIVRATRVAETELGQVVREALSEWETTNVDFKRELNLKNNKNKAEFVRDALGIATTKSSGRRFLIIGFDNNARSFHQSVDPAITQERLEQILNAYSEPAPQVRYERVPWSHGEVGLIEMFREARDIPYRVKKSLGGKDGIHEGEVFVRHGSHTEPPTNRELNGLEQEGEHARSVR